MRKINYIYFIGVFVLITGAYSAYALNLPKLFLFNEDYKKSFGKHPSARVGAIAIMTDADNTLSTAEALYKDIKVGYKNEN